MVFTTRHNMHIFKSLLFFHSASSKHKTIEFEQQMTTLTEKLMENDQEKEQLRLELRSANISLQDVQQRLHTLQVQRTLMLLHFILNYFVLLFTYITKLHKYTKKHLLLSIIFYYFKLIQTKSDETWPNTYALKIIQFEYSNLNTLNE